MINDKDILKAYIKKFFSNWYASLFSVLGILGSILMFFTPSINLILGIVVIISIIVVISSGYKVYLELFRIIPDEVCLAYLPPKIGNPEIRINQIGGKEYSFDFKEYGYIGTEIVHLDECVLPYVNCHFYFKIKNVGYIPIKIVNIYGQIDVISPFHFMVPKAIEPHETPMQYPITLNHGNEKDIILDVSILPFFSSNDAKMAVEIRNLILLRKQEKVTIRVEASYNDGKIILFKDEFYFSTEMLENMYIDHWRTLNKINLLELVGEQ